MGEINNNNWHDITDEEWKQILAKLYEYVKIKCTILPNDLEPKDIANEALKRVLEGSRKWNTEKCPDILWFLRGTVDSIISKIWKLKCNKHRIFETEKFSNLEVIEQIASDSLNDIENRECFDDRLSQLMSSVEGDEELEDLLLTMADGFLTSDELCRQLEWSKDRFYNAKRRLKRNILKSKNSKGRK